MSNKVHQKIKDLISKDAVGTISVANCTLKYSNFVPKRSLDKEETFKKMNEGFISLGEGMKIGMGVTALGSAIGIAYGIFQGSVLDPDTMTKAMDYAIEQAIQQNPEIGDEIVGAMEEAFEFFANPLISSSIGMAVSLFFGALISLLTGLALKKNRPA